MTTKSLLVIGGTGQISAACVRDAVARGFDVTVVNRGATSSRHVPAEVETLTADVRDERSVQDALGSRRFDSVADFLTFTPDQMQCAIRLYGEICDQYVFVSSASAYQKPPAALPITENTPLFNPFWQYSRDKIACERLLRDEHARGRVRATVVRPSHTYDRTQVPLLGGWTVIDRLRRGLPISLHGDGTSPWALTHSDDFAPAFLAVLGAEAAIGEAFNIMSPELLTWNMIALDLADAAGVEVPHIVHRTTHDTVQIAPEWDEPLRGDRTHAAIFDCTKILELAPTWQQTIPFAEGARRIVRWYDADESRRVVDPHIDALYDRLTASERQAA
ncbi:NAD-dependent dehydratase [Frondihabitans sp. PAMC 28766]|uniref:NAD-dependent epimerase/dehydratase family protein n=1 Tax=Frondihabitans sp. PAMC 28766 TaxID=1795630 RepID=UPI00078CD6C3|nr:NAD-dependent epimerase/dehydratase family protein [Frondihabitans sp. PAMC 28766]AMM19886.1 NAD-dependent dehydratase [Frondihabitans sp. PAMC 28766]